MEFKEVMKHTSLMSLLEKFLLFLTLYVKDGILEIL